MVVDEIKAAGGNAVANYDSVENGDRIIDTAIQTFGRIDVLLNNAGILRDVSFKNMTDQDWDLVIKVHVKGAYKVSLAEGTQRTRCTEVQAVRKSGLAPFPEAEVWTGHQHRVCSRSFWQLRPVQLLRYVSLHELARTHTLMEAAAKLSQVGFTETLAKEGYKYNILCNVIAPIGELLLDLAHASTRCC